MPIQNVPFGLESRKGRFGPEGGARLFNAFVEQAADDAKFPWVFYARPGLKPFSTLTGANGGFRGGIEFGAVAYVVAGTHVFKVDSTGAALNIGPFVGTAPVKMARNQKAPNAQVVLVSEGQRSIITADVIAAITDTDLPPPIDVCSIGGLFVFAIADGRYFWSAIEDGTEVDALDFASAEANPDGLVAIIERTQEIVLFGSESIEFHALTGSTDVFERVQQTTLKLGCLAGAAVKDLNGVPIFPASDGTVRLLDAYSPERISTHDVERDIDALAQKSAMTAETFQIDGHQFYCLNSPKWTWVCDLLTKHWFQWSSYQKDRWNAEGFVSIDGKRITGDATQGVLYELDLDTNDDGGDHLIWKLISGPVGAWPNRIIVDELYLDLISGAGLNDSDPAFSNPQITLRTSDDDGKTWSDEMNQGVGKIGETFRDVSFTQLGATGEDGFRFELSMSAAVKRALMGAAIRYQLLGP